MKPTEFKAICQTLAFGLAAATAAIGVTAAEIESPREIVIEGERIFPGSITSTRDGAVIIGSVITGQFYRAEPGASLATAWVPTGVSEAIYGIQADEGKGILWACSSTLPRDPRLAGEEAPPAPTAAVLAYDLRTGESRGHYPLPSDGCGDITVGPDGSVYATNGTEVVRLAPGGSSFQSWGGGPGAFDGETMRLNAIAYVQGRVFVGVRGGSGLMSIAVRPDGSAGAPEAVELDEPVLGADGMRAYGGNGLLVPENGAPGGRLTLITLTPAGAQRTVLQSGFPDGPISMTQVGNVAYVLEGQVPALRNPNIELKPFHAVAVDLPGQ